jgi:cysteine sulfinate desulfinase/cysteine desulfurase-like protein
MAEDFGNPSSTHSFGRNAKSVLELSRKSIAKQLNALAQEIILLLAELRPTIGFFGQLLWI